MTVVKLDPWVPHDVRDPQTVVDTIVMHSTAVTGLRRTIEVLYARGLGYHYLIAEDGTIAQCVPIERKAWHAGNSYGPQEEAAEVSRVQDAAHRFLESPGTNEYTIGISFVNLNDGSSYTPEQERAVRELIADLKERVPTLKWLTTHYAVSPGRKNDPYSYDIERLARDTELDVWQPYMS